jgi:hypothetical protein
MHVSLYDALGLAGAVTFLAAFAGIQTGRLDPHGAPYLLMNFAGAVLVLLSLLFAFNLASFFLEVCWALVALYGLVRLALKRRR